MKTFRRQPREPRFFVISSLLLNSNLLVGTPSWQKALSVDNSIRQQMKYDSMLNAYKH